MRTHPVYTVHNTSCKIGQYDEHCSLSRCFASLQPFLAKTYELTPATTGLFFMLFGATYTAFTPVFGWLMDRGVLDGFTALLLGNLGIGLALACLAPAPPLDLVLARHPWLPGSQGQPHTLVLSSACSSEKTKS